LWSAYLLTTAQCPLVKPAGIQRCNSTSALSLSLECRVGYRELCDENNFAPPEHRAGVTFWPERQLRDRHFMDSQARDQGRCILAAEALRAWGVLKLRATGVSMLPTLWPGDLLIVRSVRPEQVGPGEIVLYMRHGRFFIHRIVSMDLARNDALMVTRGDCMSENDPPVGRTELLGRVTEVHRSSAVFVPARTLSRFRRQLAWLFCRWSLFRRVGLRLWNYRRVTGAQVETTLVNAA
jgi:signal peptidase I